MSCQADLSINAAMRAVSQALKLDGGNRQMDAYIHYLKCVQYIVQILINDAQTPVFSQNSKKCLKLGQQCFGRVEKLVDVLLTEIRTSASTSYDSQSSSSPLPPTTPTTPIVSPSSDVSGSFVPGSINNVPSVPQAPGIVSRPKSLTPIEYAQRQNQQLMQAYKNRMAKIGHRTSTSSANMSLNLQRQMAENIAIAKARQLALAKKTEERQRMFQQEAAKRLASMGGMSKDEKERMYLYTKILEYEQDTRWPLMLKEKLKEHPNDESVVLELINTVIKTNDHPLSQVFTKYQRTVYNKVYPLVMKHIHQLVGIKVPFLSADGKASRSDDSQKIERKGFLEADNKTTHEQCNENRDNSQSVAQTSEAEEDDNEDAGEVLCTKPSPEEITEEIKADLEAASNKGEGEMSKLKQENADILKNMEHFDIDAMDDLFEDSDGNEESNKDSASVYSESSASASSLPYSSLTSRESVTSYERVQDDTSIDELESEAIKRHLQNMILDVKESLDRLLGMFLVTYEQLGTPAGRDLCYSCLEENFFKPLWPTVLPLFRLANKEREENVAIVMTRRENTQPADLKVNHKFCIEGEDVPYQLVIHEFHRIIEQTSPLNKLESMVKLCRLICHCVEEYYQNQEKPVPVMGADDLLPVMCYVIIRSATPQIISECNAMEEFIPEGYLMGEEGYCLTSLQTALGYCLQIDEDTPTS